MVCLFLYAVAPVSLLAQQWRFEPASQEAYHHVLRLQPEEARSMVADPQTPQDLYVHALANAIELLLTEDGELFTAYEAQFEALKDRTARRNNPDEMFLQAEISLQWSFVYFKFGHEFDAALSLRQAYLITDEIRQRYPTYLAAFKTAAILEVIVGSVPERYNWVLSLLNISGSIDTGLQLLAKLRSEPNPFADEAAVLYALVQGFVLQEAGKGMETMSALIADQRDNTLMLYVGSALAIKNAQSDKALAWLVDIDRLYSGANLYYSHYFKGEVFLHKGEYLNAISAYRWFVNHYKGQNQIKDAHYKIGVCYWLNGNENDANESFELAKRLGREVSEADKYAARSLADPVPPSHPLTRARYYTDGGYYSEARSILDSLNLEDFRQLRDKVEFNYRKARLAHLSGQITAAKTYYEKTITINGQGNWYFAPNACLQLGYITLDQGDTTAAETYFKRALSYNKHEYKNSIDTKAKSALSQIRRK
jgi:tetratricopeptide (TPR) repeat protein